MVGAIFGNDTVAFWTGTQAIVLAAAAAIAYFQLRSYLATETDKNTIELFREMDRTYIRFINFTVRTGTYRQDPARNVRRATLVLTAPSLRKHRREAMENFIECAVFFDRVALQFEQRTISRTLYMDRACALTLEVYAVLSSIAADVMPGAYDLTEFKKLARHCQDEYQRARKKDGKSTVKSRYLLDLSIPHA
jgi:hypothetical protein